MGFTKEFNGKVHQYVVEKLGAFDYRKGWMKCKCPYCGKEGKFGINISRNHCNCFRCGEHPGVVQLIMYLENLDTYQEVYKVINSGNYSGYDFREEKEEEIKDYNPKFTLPEGFRLLLFGNSAISKSARNYVKNRKLDYLELSAMGWGYCTKGSHKGYIIIPFYENHKLVYYHARLFIGNGPKYNNPVIQDTGVGKSQVIYNIDALYTYNMVYICEGVINAITMGERGIASGGKHISRYQINQIIKSPVKRVIILLDEDAREQAIDLGLSLVQYKKVKVVFMPKDKDVNDLGKSKTLKLIFSTRYQSYSDLVRLKTTVNPQILF